MKVELLSLKEGCTLKGSATLKKVVKTTDSRTREKLGMIREE
jgi:hypothetical protein